MPNVAAVVYIATVVYIERQMCASSCSPREKKNDNSPHLLEEARAQEWRF